MNISLIGFMGSGKTSVGIALANLLKFEFIEMDRMILDRTKFVNMKELFEVKGELFLREWEITLAKELQHNKKTVISTGGGVVMNKIVTDYLKTDKGQIVLLHAPFKTLEERISKDTTPRPLFENTYEAYKLFRYRLPLYKKYADLIIRTKGKTAQNIAREIVLKLYENQPSDMKDISPLKETVEQIIKVRNL